MALPTAHAGAAIRLLVHQLSRPMATVSAAAAASIAARPIGAAIVAIAAAAALVLLAVAIAEHGRRATGHRAAVLAGHLRQLTLLRGARWRGGRRARLKAHAGRRCGLLEGLRAGAGAGTVLMRMGLQVRQ